LQHLIRPTARGRRIFSAKGPPVPATAPSAPAPPVGWKTTSRRPKVTSSRPKVP